MDDGSVSAVDLVAGYQARIAAFDAAGPTLRAFVSLNPAARDQAAELDAERRRTGARGPLHGIPVVIKDNIGTADLPTSAGSRVLGTFVPAEDAFVVRRLRAAGAVILGKSNMYEFAAGWMGASSMGGQTRSPWDPARDPGGSSAGTAVAVAANLAAVGLGTDSCGSIRFPSSLNNLYGLRPTTGLVSRAGVVPLSSSLDTVGPMARTVIDLAIVLDVTVGPDRNDPLSVAVEAGPTAHAEAVDPSGLSGRRIGVPPLTVDAGLRVVLRAALGALEAHGAELVEVTLPEPGDVRPLFMEFPFALAEYLTGQSNAPARSLREIYERNLHDATFETNYVEDLEITTLDDPEYRSALEARQSTRDAVVTRMASHRLDGIAYPASFGPSVPVEADQKPFNCWIAAAAGLPVITLPAGFIDGLPVGLELMGGPFAERALITMAAGHEAATSHRRLPPTTPSLGP